MGNVSRPTYPTSSWLYPLVLSLLLARYTVYTPWSCHSYWPGIQYIPLGPVTLTGQVYSIYPSVLSLLLARYTVYTPWSCHSNWPGIQYIAFGPVTLTGQVYSIYPLA